MQSIFDGIFTVGKCYWTSENPEACVAEVTISNIASSSVDWMKAISLFAGDKALQLTHHAVNVFIDVPFYEKALKICQEAKVIGTNIEYNVMQSIAPNAKEIINQETFETGPYSLLKLTLAGGMMYWTAKKAGEYTKSAFGRLATIVSGTRQQTVNFRTSGSNEFTAFRDYTTIGLIKDATIEFIIASAGYGAHYLTKELMIQALIQAGEEESNARQLMTMISALTLAPLAIKALKWLCTEDTVDLNHGIQMGNYSLSHINGGPLKLFPYVSVEGQELIHPSLTETSPSFSSFQPEVGKEPSQPTYTPSYYSPSGGIAWDGSKFTTDQGLSSVPPSFGSSAEASGLGLLYDSPKKVLTAAAGG